MKSGRGSGGGKGEKGGWLLIYLISIVDAVLADIPSSNVIAIVHAGKITGALAVAIAHAFWHVVAVTEAIRVAVGIAVARSDLPHFGGRARMAAVPRY